MDSILGHNIVSPCTRLFFRRLRRSSTMDL